MPKGDTLTAKQERFALNIFKGMSQRQAYLDAGYSPRQSDTTIDQHAMELAKNALIVVRIAELTKQAEDATIMDVKERKQICTQGARGELRDVEVIETVGPDGSKTITKKVKAAPRSPYIAELNKMEKVYVEEKGGDTYNTQINIVVESVNGESMLKRVMTGERTVKELNGGINVEN